MDITKRVIAVFLCMAMLIWTIVTGVMYTGEEEEAVSTDHESIIIWYTDEALEDYLNAAAVAYHEEYGVRVLPKLQTLDEYLENINEASLSGGEYPDLYIMSNDMLEKAYLSGLASEIRDENGTVENNFPQAAVDAVTYKDKAVAYPFYFETTALLYNKTYLYNRAKDLILAEDALENEDAAEAESGEDSSETEDTGEEASEEQTDPELEARVYSRMDDDMPQTFDELLTFADEYDAPAEVEAIFKWDVKDIFYNYFFIGSYIDIGGTCGDDSSVIDIYNENSIRAMQVYQDMNQFFSFEYDDISYSSVIEEFLQGKVVFTTATTDILNTLDEAIKNEEFTYEYGVIGMPKLNEELTTKNLSVTNTIVINGYSNKIDEANRVARYLAIDNAADLYGKSGKLSANKNITYDNPYASVFFEEYAKSQPIPKMMATANFWMQFEVGFAQIWAGGSVSDNLKALSEQMKYQVTGQEIEEEYIDIQDETEDIEYYDEEEETQAAMQEGE